jgi:hypothetical protein
MLFSPFRHIVPEIELKASHADKLVTRLSLAEVSVVPFTRLIVVSNHAAIVADEREPVFVGVHACPDGRIDSPDNHLDESRFRLIDMVSEQQFGFHAPAM